MATFLTKPNLSKQAGVAWHNLPELEKKHYHDLAKQAEVEHKAKYPDYVYRPRRFIFDQQRHDYDASPPPAYSRPLRVSFKFMSAADLHTDRSV